MIFLLDIFQSIVASNEGWQVLVAEPVHCPGSFEVCSRLTAAIQAVQQPKPALLLEAHHLADKERKVLLWELSLIGLRMELQALDQHLVHPPSVATHETFEIRYLQLLHDVLGGEPLDLTSCADRDVGFNAYHVADRVKAVEAFRLLVL